MNAANVLRHHTIEIDVVQIDGGHDCHAVTSDLREWWPMIRPEGVVIEDDYPHWPGVKKAFDDFFIDQGKFHFDVDPPKCRICK